MITLELSVHEARELMKYLSLHALGSAVDTYPAYVKLDDALGDQAVSARESLDLMSRTQVISNGLFEVKEQS